VTLRGRIGGAALVLDAERDLNYSFVTARTSTSTRRLYLIAHLASGRRTPCSLAGCEAVRLKAP